MWRSTDDVSREEALLTAGMANAGSMRAAREGALQRHEQAGQRRGKSQYRHQSGEGDRVYSDHEPAAVGKMHHRGIQRSGRCLPGHAVGMSPGPGVTGRARHEDVAGDLNEGTQRRQSPHRCAQLSRSREDRGHSRA